MNFAKVQLFQEERLLKNSSQLKNNIGIKNQSSTGLERILVDSVCLIDYTFLIVGRDEGDQAETEYLYWLKEGTVRFRYRLHHEILYIAQN